MFEYVQRRRKGFRFVQIMVVGAYPVKGFSRNGLNSRSVDPAFSKPFKVRFRKVLTHDSDDLNRRIERGGNGEVIDRAAQDSFDLTGRSLDGIESNGTDSQDRFVFFHGAPL